MKTRNSKSTENLRQIFLRLTTMELLHSVWQHQLTTLLRFEPIGKGKEEPTSKLTTHSAEPSSGCGRRRTHVFPSFLPPFSRVQRVGNYLSTIRKPRSWASSGSHTRKITTEISVFSSSVCRVDEPRLEGEKLRGKTKTVYAQVPEC